MAYTTVEEIQAELGGVTFSTSSTPTKAQVEGWIKEAEAEIDSQTGKVWGIRTVTSASYEYSDYDGSGRIRFDNTPVISVQSLEFEENGVSQTESWVSLVEGRDATGDYVLYKDFGVAKVHGTLAGKKPKVGTQNIRKTYTYGKVTTPRTIKRLATMIVAKRHMNSIASKTATEEGGSITVGAISITDPNNYSLNRVKEVDREIDRLYEKVVGDFRTHLFDNQLYT